ncbi:MAG: dihydrodipicolinate synthase family protein [Marmoricola sp.]|nr:dihydrodipicolinate synthase family protein [Marmoricola sp.]
MLATPFHGEHAEVDRESLRRAVELYESAGAVGVVALGVFGEAARLTVQERALVVHEVVEATSSCAVVVGLTAIDTEDACLEAEQAMAASSGRISAVMVQANSSAVSELRSHLEAVHRACDLPIVLQDYPVASGVRVSTDVIADAASLDCVVAVKCESPPTSPAIASLAALTDVPLFGGLGGIGLLDELQAGAAGAMTGFSYPEALESVISAWSAGGYEAAREAILPWLPLINFEAQIGVGLAIRKENLRRRGVLSDARVRPPGLPLPNALLDLVAAHGRGIEGMVD